MNCTQPVKTIGIEIQTCMGCPYHTTKRHYTSDSFEMAFDYYCTKMPIMQDEYKQVASYIEREREMPEIPEWCPLLIKG